jgi:hypothetical protein
MRESRLALLISMAYRSFFGLLARSKTAKKQAAGD